MTVRHVCNIVAHISFGNDARLHDYFKIILKKYS